MPFVHSILKHIVQSVLHLKHLKQFAKYTVKNQQQTKIQSL